VEARRLLRQAIKKSEIRADLDPDRVLDLLYGPLYLRLLLKHAPLDEDFVNTVFEVVSPALCARTDASQAPPLGCNWMFGSTPDAYFHT